MTDTTPSGGPARPRTPHDFDAMYVAGVPPWDIGRPQPAFQQLADHGGLDGAVLDVGCGTGEHALLAASHGHHAVGVDIAPQAIELATAKARERNLDARFVVGDAMELAALGERFDTVLDCGLFHTFEDVDRGPFARSLASVVPTGGRYHLLCFSEREPGDWGPRRVTQDEIRSSFADGWVVESIEPCVIEITIRPVGSQAWHAVLRRA